MHPRPPFIKQNVAVPSVCLKAGGAEWTYCLKGGEKEPVRSDSEIFVELQSHLRVKEWPHL